MNISDQQRQEIEKIIAEMKSSGLKCRKDYECYKSAFEKLCNTKAVSTLIECRDKKACVCGLSFSFGDSHFCKCPLRRYIAKHFHK